MVFRPFYVRCGQCGHRNRPHNSPREGVRRALLGQLPPCKRCGKPLSLSQLPDRPLVRQVRQELAQQGLLGNSQGCPETSRTQ